MNMADTDVKFHNDSFLTKVLLYLFHFLYFVIYLCFIVVTSLAVFDSQQISTTYLAVMIIFRRGWPLSENDRRFWWQSGFLCRSLIIQDSWPLGDGKQTKTVMFARWQHDSR